MVSAAIVVGSDTTKEANLFFSVGCGILGWIWFWFSIRQMAQEEFFEAWHRKVLEFKDAKTIEKGLGIAYMINACFRPIRRSEDEIRQEYLRK